MSEILRNLSGTELRRISEASLYSNSPFPYNLPQAEVYEGEDICWCVTDIPFDACNMIFKTRLKPEQIDTTIESIIEIARKKNVPLRWWLTADTEPANLGEYLANHGFEDLGEGSVMAADLLALDEDTQMPSGLEIREVKEKDDLKTWCHILALGFGMPPENEPVLYKWSSISMDMKLPVQFYLAYLDNEPVATSQLSLSLGVAGIYCVGTVPEARNRGIGYAITLHPLRIAKEMGYAIGVLQASPMGEPVYRKMGFKEYGKIAAYRWRPPGE